MEEYRAKIKKHLLGNSIALCIFCCALAIYFANRYKFILAAIDTPNAAFVSGFQCGIATAMVLVLVMDIVKYARALKNEARLNQMQIKEKDERTLFIWQKAGSVGMNIALYGLLLATLVAGGFDFTVFYTLLGATIFLILVRLGLSLYYKWKY